MKQVIEFTSAALKVSAMALPIASVSIPVSLLVISLPELSAMMLPFDQNKITHTYKVDNYYFRAPFLAFIQFPFPKLKRRLAPNSSPAELWG
jgi:hypothetical protein